MKLAWCTDIHLDHVSEEVQEAFVHDLIKDDPEGILITGDIAESESICDMLLMIERIAQRPVYFVLGNHDYYYGSIANVRKRVHDTCNQSHFLKYLSIGSYSVLSPDTALIGHDCWYDAQNGIPVPRMFLMSDWMIISDFVEHSGGRSFVHMYRDVKDKDGLIALAKKLATEGTIHIANNIKSAIKYHNNIVIATHAPPFKESHMFEGKVGNDIAQPWFTNKTLGDMLLDAAKANPTINFTVYAGHTHGEYTGKFAKNLTVHVGHAEYKHPKLAQLITV